MRRSTATALLMLILGALVAPAALATTANPLPACCRAGGRHHCSATVSSGKDPQVQGHSCPYRKPVAFSVSLAPPPAAETVALADAYAFLNESYSEVFISHRELPYSQRAPPSASAVK
jgi:hypothetical protein